MSAAFSAFPTVRRERRGRCLQPRVCKELGIKGDYHGARGLFAVPAMAGPRLAMAGLRRAARRLTHDTTVVATH